MDQNGSNWISFLLPLPITLLARAQKVLSRLYLRLNQISSKWIKMDQICPKWINDQLLVTLLMAWLWRQRALHCESPGTKGAFPTSAVVKVGSVQPKGVRSFCATNCWFWCLANVMTMTTHWTKFLKICSKSHIKFYHAGKHCTRTIIIHS